MDAHLVAFQFCFVISFLRLRCALWIYCSLFITNLPRCLLWASALCSGVVCCLVIITMANIWVLFITMPYAKLFPLGFCVYSCMGSALHRDALVKGQGDWDPLRVCSLIWVPWWRVVSPAGGQNFLNCTKMLSNAVLVVSCIQSRLILTTFLQSRCDGITAFVPGGCKSLFYRVK